MQDVDSAIADAAQMRRAGSELLSLALIDARNHTLRWAGAFESSPAGPAAIGRELGRIGWFQEHWIARNMQRGRGSRCDPAHPKLASILPGADGWFDPANAIGDAADAADVPDLQTLRQYLVDTLETTLELLAGSADEDDALYFFRLALLREDACIERFAVLAQTLGLDTGLQAPLAARPARAPLLFPATRWPLGSDAGGFVPDREQWAHEVALPEFEIDAQVVDWAQYGEFVEDGGYDDPRHWSAPGWAWVQAQGRRTPRHVDQLRHGVLLQRFGRLVRAPATQPVVHVSAFEAEAWCCWAGRRLPGEAEWEAAAVLGANRGLRWGDVAEWCAGTLRPYPGFGATAPGQAGIGMPSGAPAPRVLRGASFATAARLRHPKARRAETPDRDDGFFGFRSCAL